MPAPATPAPFRILAWNILHGGGPKRIPEIALSLLSHAPDIVVLSEFRHARGGQLRAMLADAGLEHHLSSTNTSSNTTDPAAHARGNTILVASHLPIEPIHDGPALDAPRFLHARLNVTLTPSTPLTPPLPPPLPLDLIAVHIPDQVEDGRKARFWRHLVNQAPTWSASPSVLLGDLNTARRGIDTLRNDFGVSSCADLMGAFATAGFQDAWLAANPGQREPTWSLPPALEALIPHGNPRSSGSRIDAAYVSLPLRPHVARIAHDHTPRKSGISDHSMLLLDLANPPHQQPPRGESGQNTHKIGPAAK